MKNQVRPKWAKLCKGESGIDIKCLKLCEAINRFPGTETISSCCGHNKDRFMIFFKTKYIKSLFNILQFFDGYYDWIITVQTNGFIVYFMIEGSKGKKSYKEAEQITKLMSQWKNKQKLKETPEK
jgi:hypothetical protein